MIFKEFIPEQRNVFYFLPFILVETCPFKWQHKNLTGSRSKFTMHTLITTTGRCLYLNHSWFPCISHRMETLSTRNSCNILIINMVNVANIIVISVLMTAHSRLVITKGQIFLAIVSKFFTITKVSPEMYNSMYNLR